MQAEQKLLLSERALLAYLKVSGEIYGNLLCIQDEIFHQTYHPA